MGGECEACTGDGRVSNAIQSMCESCFPGLEPAENLSTCIPCLANEFSQFGYACVDCPHPRTVNADRSTCTTCPPGFGPVDPSWSAATIFDNRDTVGLAGNLTGPGVDYVCAPCVSTSYSAEGVCLTCVEPQVVDAEHRTCRQCLGGEDPNSNRTQCLACEGPTYSAGGAECLWCPEPNHVNAERTMCLPCPGTLEFRGGVSIVRFVLCGRVNTLCHVAGVQLARDLRSSNSTPIRARIARSTVSAAWTATTLTTARWECASSAPRRWWCRRTTCGAIHASPGRSRTRTGLAATPATAGRSVHKAWSAYPA
eukprot:SAG22_NODE_21_length_31784_cov_15.522897_20_plen_311_part_00